VRKQRVGGSQQVSAKPNDVPREPAAAVLKPNAAGEGTARSARFPEAIGARAGWLKEGKLKQKEDVAIGNAPNTLARLFTGENFGKQLLKIADGRLFPGDARAASKRLNRFLKKVGIGDRRKVIHSLCNIGE
jgi:hypothetical protein